MSLISRLDIVLQYLSSLSHDNKKGICIQLVQCMNAPVYLGEKNIHQKLSVEHLNITQF